MNRKCPCILVILCFLSVLPYSQAKRFHRDSSAYGSGEISAEVFDPPPPVQNPNGAVTQTMEICDLPGDPTVCGVDHAFIYGFGLGVGDPGVITSITLTATAQNGELFSVSPNYGVLICNVDGAQGVPCSPTDASLTNCADADGFQVREDGIGTSTYTQTWNFASCPVFGAGQSLAIFIDLRVPTDPSPPDDSPNIVPPVFVTINVVRPSRFVPVTPCRVIDTRIVNGVFGAPTMAAGSTRDFPIPQGACSIPSNAVAYALNFTVAPHGPLGYLTVWPSGQLRPLASTLNSLDGRVKANAAIVPAGNNGAISAFVTDTTDLIADINGYFVVDASQLAFYPLSPCRVLDTRNSNDALGGPSLIANSERQFPIQSSPCGITLAAQAYSMNFTAIPHHTLGYLTVWPSGSGRPIVSTLNAPTGAVTANAAIVPAGANGDLNVFATDDTDLVVDINGYFGPPDTGAQSLYTLSPCRVVDTRDSGAFSGQLTLDVVGSPCNIPSAAQAFVLNATVVPQHTLGYLTLWPNGASQPVVSTLNAPDGATTSNMAIVPTANGLIDAFATDPTQLILDISSYFAP